MASPFEDSIQALRDDAWVLARAALDSGRVHAYRSLTNVVEQLTSLASSNEQRPSEQSGSDGNGVSLEIFARYKGTTHDAKLARSRINGGRGACVRFREQWMTVSAAARAITGTNVNGWRFWRYRRSDGSTAIIDQLR